MNATETKLIRFAVMVLEMLEDDHDWGSETMDMIGSFACDFDLAELDEDDYFAISDRKAINAAHDAAQRNAHKAA